MMKILSTKLSSFSLILDRYKLPFELSFPLDSLGCFPNLFTDFFYSKCGYHHSYHYALSSLYYIYFIIQLLKHNTH